MQNPSDADNAVQDQSVGNATIAIRPGMTREQFAALTREQHGAEALAQEMP